MNSLNKRFHDEVFVPYRDFLKAEYRFFLPNFSHAKKIWENKLTYEQLVHGSFLEKSTIYAPGRPVQSLPLDERTKATVLKKLSGRSLYKHQSDALEFILNGKNAVIATGTSSGKTLCYQIPILDDLIRSHQPGLRAVIIYPLNALVNDQLNEWEELLQDHPKITFARFTGQTPNSGEEYRKRIETAKRKQFSTQQFSQTLLERKVREETEKQLHQDPPNRLNHRDAIRSTPPNILITNFSMLEYLLERPIDAPIFRDARLMFLVLDEAHAYRGVQATEIAYLIRRLKAFLKTEALTCISTSATLGSPDDPTSISKVRKFASDLFGETFQNPVYGTSATPVLKKPSFTPSPLQYIDAAESLSKNPDAELVPLLTEGALNMALSQFLQDHDANVFRLRKDILTKPTLLNEAATAIWPDHPKRMQGLEGLLNIISTAKKDDLHEDLLPTRLHYFVKSQDGLYMCLHSECPGRTSTGPPVFLSRKNEDEVPEGYCPDCFSVPRHSMLVEVVSCRKCGYLFGALQDLGPRRRQNPDSSPEEGRSDFDSFTTELGWAADSYWTYFSIDNELPYPTQPKSDEEEDLDLFENPDELDWCVVCGKKSDPGKGDNCVCSQPHIRKIKIFHRQCPYEGKAGDSSNLSNPQKAALTFCPNCGIRNASGLEPVRRFQESQDETGIAMAIPLAHFQTNPSQNKDLPRKLLCFTDHRQRAAAFPALLEEETFSHDMGRQIVKILKDKKTPIDLLELGNILSEMSESNSDFFLPTSRLPDEDLTGKPKEKRNLWLAETFSYFGIPDSARESAEDLGLVAIEVDLSEKEREEFSQLFGQYGLSKEETTSILQILLRFVRQRKAFTLPSGVRNDAPAFGRVIADIGYSLEGSPGDNNIKRWIPKNIPNPITSYLSRLLKISAEDTKYIAESIWKGLTTNFILIENRGKWKLNHEKLYVRIPKDRFKCSRCNLIISYAPRFCCPQKECDGTLVAAPFDPTKENLIARWVADQSEYPFYTLNSEEHTAQISKEVAKVIEDEFRSTQAQGVNLLSSTTTFEMGINIGDLQKVLLRNAPPSSANYVQRVGRAGRGKDKNSICVTLCSRTKYDLDSWNDPLRLMSGKVHTPIVFLNNHFIGRRHFNAVVFAHFLRDEIAEKRLLGVPKQQIPVEAFIPLPLRQKIPSSWIKVPLTVHLDFPTWLNQQKRENLLDTKHEGGLTTSFPDFNASRDESVEKYKEIIENLGNEIQVLVSEYWKIIETGDTAAAGEIGKSVQGILKGDIINIMAKREFLPRYAFPLDVVTLETGLSRWHGDEEVELSRDRSIAISEFAPGAQVIARKKVYTSAGLYIVGERDQPDRMYFSECPSCGQIRTDIRKESLEQRCNVCDKSINSQFITPFIEPTAFSIDVLAGEARYRRSTLIRQKQSLTHFIDQVENAQFENRGSFSVALKESGKLFRYNMGSDRKGFMLCKSCGRSESMKMFRPGRKHKKLRTFSSQTNCLNDRPWPKIAYGHKFNSFCLIARPIQRPTSIESVAFALQKGLSKTLDIEPFDVAVSWRWRAQRKDANTPVEIVLFDRAPGGSGFVKEAFDGWNEVIENSRKVATECNCETACYECLKDYSNQSFHDKLDRKKVIEFFENAK